MFFIYCTEFIPAEKSLVSTWMGDCKHFLFKKKNCPEEIFKKEEMNLRMGMGLIKLICKSKVEQVDLKNYRPITMLNTDLKINKSFSQQIERGNANHNQNKSSVWSGYSVKCKGKDIANTTISIIDRIRSM